MTTEEKARAYDEALERVNSKWHYKNQPCFIDVAEIFPELKESEDEIIRKSIIAIINNYVDNSNTFKPKMLAWLEKQGTQNIVLDELEMTLSVSEDAYLRSNIEKLIKELKEDEQ